MSKVLYVRISDELHDVLRRRAEREAKSLALLTSELLALALAVEGRQADRIAAALERIEAMLEVAPRLS